MNIVLFSSEARYALAAVGVLLLAVTVILIRGGRPRFATMSGVGALTALGALAGEALVALTVRINAPSATDFNEYRWVFLSPYGRWGFYIGLCVVAAIVALAWRASRGSSTAQRARPTARSTHPFAS